MSNIDFPFKPKSELSKSLLSSIPKKVFLWLENLQQDQTRPFTHGPFVYLNAGHHGLLTHISGDEIIQIAWTGEAPNIETVCASDPRFEEIEFNLEWFTTVENRIYSEMERFEKEISIQDASFPEISNSQLIHQSKNEND